MKPAQSPRRSAKIRFWGFCRENQQPHALQTNSECCLGEPEAVSIWNKLEYFSTGGWNPVNPRVARMYCLWLQGCFSQAHGALNGKIGLPSNQCPKGIQVFVQLLEYLTYMRWKRSVLVGCVCFERFQTLAILVPSNSYLPCSVFVHRRSIVGLLQLFG